MDYTITTDAWKVADAFQVERLRAPTRTGAIVQRHAQKILDLVRRYSPYNTGEYMRSHDVTLWQPGVASFHATIGTDLPRGTPLEFGGSVTDSRGTTRHFRPRPHYRPAFDEVAPLFEQELVEFLFK